MRFIACVNGGGAFRIFPGLESKKGLQTVQLSCIIARVSGYDERRTGFTLKKCRVLIADVEVFTLQHETRIPGGVISPTQSGKYGGVPVSTGIWRQDKRAAVPDRLKTGTL